MFRKILRIESLTDSARLCQPTEAQNSPRAAMNFLSSSIRLGSRSDLISPLHPPRPLNAILHQPAQSAASSSSLNSSLFRASPRPCRVAVLAKPTSKALVGELASRSRNSWPSVLIVGLVFQPELIANLMQHRRAGAAFRLGTYSSQRRT